MDLYAITPKAITASLRAEWLVKIKAAFLLEIAAIFFKGVAFAYESLQRHQCHWSHRDRVNFGVCFFISIYIGVYL